MPKTPLPQPRRGLDLLIDHEAHARHAASQRACAEEAATKVERGEPLDDMQKRFVAFALRKFAERVPLEQPRRRGQAPRFCAATATLGWAVLRRIGMTVNQADEQIADQHGVSVTAFKK